MERSFSPRVRESSQRKCNPGWREEYVSIGQMALEMTRDIRDMLVLRA